MRTFTDIINTFGLPHLFAAETGIDPDHARVMKFRDSIPAAYWPLVIAAADRRGFSHITYERLAAIAAEKAHKRQREALAS